MLDVAQELGELYGAIYSEMGVDGRGTVGGEHSV